MNLPPLGPEAFATSIHGLAPESLSPETLASLHAHYEELRRWSPRLALIGPGTADEVLARHFGESLAALPFLAADHGDLVDVGSGAGFPGLVLAAARPGWRVTLVEPRERKWAFLQAAARRGALVVRILNARVDALLPEGLPEAFDVVTVRALRLPVTSLEALAARLRPRGRFLFWAGGDVPPLPAGWRVTAAAPLPRAQQRRLLVVEREAGDSAGAETQWSADP